MTRTSNLLQKLACAVVLTIVTGCGYGEVSPKTYEYTQALYSITNRQAAEKLGEFEAKLDLARTTGELNESEVELLQGIAETAKGGDWKAAQQDCRGLMEAQIQARKQ